MKALMKAMAKNPHLPLWLFSGFFLLAFFLSFVVFFDPVALNIHKTYYVIATSPLYQFLSLWFAGCAVGYMVLKQRKITPIFWLGILHLLLSVLALTGLLIPDLFTVVDSDYRGLNVPITMYDVDANQVVLYAIVLFLVAQCLYIINIAMALGRSILSGKR
ncbi:MAG: hypothetical protein AB3N14_09100 [Flavobacteriaceae bacterium]